MSPRHVRRAPGAGGTPTPAPADAALDALAAALAPRVARLLREQSGEPENALADVLQGTGFEVEP